MEQRKKELLIKDLSGRVPYGVKVQIDLQSDTYPPITGKVVNIECSDPNSAFISVETSPGIYNEFREFLCKPYLFPPSSISEEIMDEIYEASGVYDIGIDSPIHIEVGTTFEDLTKIFNILNKHHIDYNGLIPNGLAIDSTKLNIY